MHNDKFFQRLTKDEYAEREKRIHQQVKDEQENYNIKFDEIRQIMNAPIEDWDNDRHYVDMHIKKLQAQNKQKQYDKELKRLAQLAGIAKATETSWDEHLRDVKKEIKAAADRQLKNLSSPKSKR